MCPPICWGCSLLSPLPLPHPFLLRRGARSLTLHPGRTQGRPGVGGLSAAEAAVRRPRTPGQEDSSGFYSPAAPCPAACHTARKTQWRRDRALGIPGSAFSSPLATQTTRAPGSGDTSLSPHPLLLNSNRRYPLTSPCKQGPIVTVATAEGQSQRPPPPEATPCRASFFFPAPPEPGTVSRTSRSTFPLLAQPSSCSNRTGLPLGSQPPRATSENAWNASRERNWCGGGNAGRRESRVRKGGLVLGAVQDARLLATAVGNALFSPAPTPMAGLRLVRSVFPQSRTGTASGTCNPPAVSVPWEFWHFSPVRDLRNSLALHGSPTVRI